MRVNGDTITQSETKIFDSFSEIQLSSERDASRLEFEPTRALPEIAAEMSAHMINYTSEDWRKGEGARIKPHCAGVLCAARFKS